jgi:preprotein translocase subunit SecG
MENVVLIVHLIIALCLIAIVLLQRSEGGGLGMGGGGGGGGVMSSRSAATALGKLTWGFAIAFIVTSITLTIISASKSADTSVIDRLGVAAPASAPAADPSSSGLPTEADLLPPSSSDEPLTPPRAD